MKRQTQEEHHVKMKTKSGDDPKRKQRMPSAANQQNWKRDGAHSSSQSLEKTSPTFLEELHMFSTPRL